MWLWLAVFACAAVDAGSSPGVEAGGPAPATAATSADVQSLSGVLTWNDVAGRMSVDAYLGREFVIATAGGEVVLGAASTITSEQLQSFNGKQVSVTCTLHDQPAPDPASSFPTEASGKPLARPPMCDVSAISEH